MKKPSIPYKITRTDLPGNLILIKGRMLGLNAIGPVVMLPVAITLLLLYHPEHYMVCSVLCAVLFLIQPFICRFKIELSPSFVTVQITYSGFTTKRIEVPFEKVLIKANGFRDINEQFFEDYRKNEDNYLAMEFDDAFDGPVYYVSLGFKGKEIAFTAWQASFEAELWEMLKAAIRETYTKRRQCK